MRAERGAQVKRDPVPEAPPKVSRDYKEPESMHQIDLEEDLDLDDVADLPDWETAGAKHDTAADRMKEPVDPDSAAQTVQGAMRGFEARQEAACLAEIDSAASKLQAGVRGAEARKLTEPASVAAVPSPQPTSYPEHASYAYSPGEASYTPQTSYMPMYDVDLDSLAARGLSMADELEYLHSLKQSLMAQDIGTQDGVQRPIGVANTRELHQDILSSGLTISGGKLETVRGSVMANPEKTVVMLCALPLGNAELIRILRDEVLPLLNISHTTKVELLRELVINPTLSDVGNFRDRLLEAIHLANY